jgi:hypothetical protein
VPCVLCELQQSGLLANHLDLSPWFDKRTAVICTRRLHHADRISLADAFSLVVGFFILVLLVVVLIALHRERVSDEPPHGLVPFIVVVLGMSTFVALMTAYARVTKIVEPQRISARMPTV